MPEGDNIHRNAVVLGRHLTGQPIARLMVHDRGEVSELIGRTVEKVEAVGKHLLIHIEGGWVLRVHLGMKGSWQRRHIAERFPPSPTVIIVTGETAYICDGSYRAELLGAKSLRTHSRLAQLGPDLLAEPAPIEEAAARAAWPAHAEREVADVLLDQRIAAGIGNIYKSEVLFECRVHPCTKMRALPRETITQLYSTAARLMRLNLLIRNRTTVPLRRRTQPTTTRFWVYRRNGKPCLDCRTPIEYVIQGDMGRSTYWCPVCQVLVSAGLVARPYR